jgi:shikimate dehydrogenase
MRVTASTRVFALLGDPVSHSLSPRMHNAGFRAAGIDAVYVALRTMPGDLHAQMRMLTANGGGGNVTVPHKQHAATGPGSRDARVQLLGAANIFGVAGDGMCLGNCDVDGILGAIDQLGIDARPWCVIGTGGSARAVAGAARERGVALAVRSRDAATAAAFSSWASSIGVALAVPDECGVIVNATPLGLRDHDALPADPGSLPPTASVLDLVYRDRHPTPWVAACAARGMRGLDGKAVLLAQGIACWRWWFPDVATPTEVLRAAVGDAMA